MYVWLIFISLVNVIFIISVDIKPEINKYCRAKDRLITSEENDEYLLVSAEINTTILLECQFCGEGEEKQPKIWYFQDRNQNTPEKEVELGMDNNSSYNRMHITPEFSLVIKDFYKTDAGIYRCHGKEGQEKENKFNYRVEPVFKDKDDYYIEKGNLTDWENYRKINLASVTTRFAVSRMPDLVSIRDAGITLELITEWAPWGPCERCVRKRGFKTSRGYCRLKRRLNKTSTSTDSFAVDFFKKTPMLPCKSTILHDEFPSISSATRYLPEFILEEKCKSCPKVKKAKKRRRFKYKRRYVLAEGAHLAVSCPESNMDSEVVWKKDAVTLKKGTGRSFRRKDPEARVMVDTFSTLYLIDISEDEQGNYTCYVDNVNMMQVKVIVVSNSRLLTQAFFRHMAYLAFIFLLTSFCYCGGLAIVCKQKDRFEKKDYEKIEQEEQEKTPFTADND